MTVEWLGPLPEGNFLVGRHGYTVDLLVMHHMDGTLAGSDAWFHNPESGVSSTFGVGRNSRCVQWLAVEDVPYANGDWIANLTSETFEWEDLNQDRPGVPAPSGLYTDEQYAAGSALVRERALARGIPIQRGSWAGGTPGIVCHHDITNTYCPGTLDVERIVKEANSMDEETVKRLVREVLVEDGYPNFVKAATERLAIDAHHTHDVPLAGVATSEPK